MGTSIEKLNTRLTKKQKEIESHKEKIKSLQKQLSIMFGEQREIFDAIFKHKCNGSIRISDHAKYRYLERVKGVRFNEREILTDELLELVDKLGGNGKYPVGKYQVVIKDYTVTTIL